ncbi:MAG: hypothetical protein KF773_37345 [Deltaproteobacteria bacterium]|nr:hypothetical protein [Deltaproteobacteria bacterium]
MLRPAIVLAAVLALTGTARAIEVGRPGGMYTPAGVSLAVVESKVEVTVRGPILETVVTQQFRNATDHPTEATYIFPLPHDAAVSAMSIRSGARTIHASIEPREDAQRRYEQAISSGVAAALLDQERADVFTQTVAAIPARGVVEITLRYDSVARFQDGTWELALPLVVAPRYVPGAATGRGTTGVGRSPDTDRAPDASRVTPPASPGAGGPTDVVVHFDARPEGATSPSHELVVRGNDVAFRDPKSDHDAIVRWKGSSAGGWVEQGPDGGYAAVVVTAPPAPAKRGVAQVKYLLALDRSAASRGDADSVARPLVRSLLGGLAGSDRVAVTGSDAIAWSAPADVARNLEAVWTGAPAAFDLTRVLLAARPDGAPIVLVTGGLVADDAAAVAAAKKLGVPIHVVGVGPAPARGLLVQIAAASGGTVRFAQVGDDLAALARAVVHDASTPPAALSVTWGTLTTVDVVPAGLPRLGAGQALLVLARVNVAGGGRVGRANGRANGELFAIELVPPAKVGEGATSAMGPLARRWARNRLDEMLAGRVDRAAVAKHALRYGLVSPFTSMVAIGDEVVVEGGVKRSVPVQVSVPAGMKWQAIKNETHFSRREVAGNIDPTTTTAAKTPDVAGSTVDQGRPNQPSGGIREADAKPPVATRNDPPKTGGKPVAKPAEDPPEKKPEPRLGVAAGAPPTPAPVPPSVDAHRGHGKDKDKDKDKKDKADKTSKDAAARRADKNDDQAAKKKKKASDDDQDDVRVAKRTLDDEEKPAKKKPAKKESATSERRQEHADGDRDGADDDEEGTRRYLGRAPLPMVSASGSYDAELTASGLAYGRRHRNWRSTVSLGGGVLASRGAQLSVFALGGRFEVGGRTLAGLDTALWLVDGEHLEGRVMLAFSRHVARRFELGGGAGLHAGGGVGPALSLGLRYHLPPLPRAAAYLRYDGALLVDEGEDPRGVNTFSFGLEVGF